MIKMFIFLILMTTSSVAFADQCSVLPAKSAHIAKELLSNHLRSNTIAVIDRYCESCRDEVATPIVIDTVTIKDFQVDGFKEIYVNEKKIDLAYIYLEGVNIAGKIGCKAFGISEYL
jgi:hypothetical protein